MSARDGSAFPVWACARGTYNLMGRNPCGCCREYRPCDQYVGDGRTCGAVPTSLYAGGIRCDRHVGSLPEYQLAGLNRSAARLARGDVWAAPVVADAPTVDGRRPEIDPMLFGVPDKVRACAEKTRAAGWTAWSAVLEAGGVGGRGRVLLVAYRGSEMVVLPWDQGADLTWKAGKGSRWIGRVPDGAGQVSMTALMKVMTDDR